MRLAPAEGRPRQRLVPALLALSLSVSLPSLQRAHAAPSEPPAAPLSLAPSLEAPERPAEGELIEAGGFQLQRGLGAELLLLDAASRMPLRRWPLRDRLGRNAAGSGALLLLHAAARRSFLVVIVGLRELWEISYDPAAEPLFDGLVHDYRMGEGIASPGYLGLRRTPLEQPLVEAVLVAGRPWLLAQQGEDVVVIHLDARRLIARVPRARLAGLRLLQRGSGMPPLLLMRGSEAMTGLLALDSAGWRLVDLPPEAQAAMRE